MNINTRLIWRLQPDGDNFYWMNRALEAAEQDSDGGGRLVCGDLTDAFYTTPEAAAKAAIFILKKLIELPDGPLVAPAPGTDFKNEEDEMQAARSIGKRPLNCERRYRWSGEPQIETRMIEDGEGWRKVCLIRPCEIMFYFDKKVKKTIEVDGVTWTREVEETLESDWFPAEEPDETTFTIYSQWMVEIS